MDATRQDKIKKFMADERMSGAVKEVLLGSFMKPRGHTDINMLAASRIAIDLLEDGFKDLKKYTQMDKNIIKQESNVGF